MRRIFLCSMLIMLLTCIVGSLFAADETIYDIKVEGAVNIDAELVTSALSFRVGDTLDPEDVAKSIRNLYKMGVFADIQFSSEAYRTGINIIVKVVENPVVSSIEYIGFKAVKRERIDELVTLRVGSYWSEAVKTQLLSKLKAEYATKGFTNANIDIFEAKGDKNKIGLKIQAEEGKRVSVKQITFVGNTAFTDKMLIKRMKTKPASFIRSGRFEQEKFDKDLMNLASYYKKNGYIDVHVGPYELLSLNEKSMELVINIDEGIQYNFGSVIIEGNDHFSAEILQAVFTLKSGEPFDQEKFDSQMGKLYSIYFDEGFIYSEIKPDYQKDDNLVNVLLAITENTRARIRQIHITGNRRTKEKVIRRQLEIAPGDYFRQTQVLRTQQNIYNLGFFEQDIKLDYERINSEGDIDLQLDVQDKSSGIANGGVGYNSQDNFVGQLSFSQNNLFGNNWSSGLKWEFGGSTQNFEFNFTNPNLYDSDLLLGTNIYYTKKNWSSFYYEIFTRGAGLRLGQALPWIDRTRVVAGYSLYSKKYRITDMASILENETANATLIELDSLEWRYTSALNFTLSRDTRDNVFFPTNGSQFTLFSEVAGGPLGGNFDYYKQIAQVNWYTDTWKKIVLRTKWRFCYVTPYGSSDDAPPDEKFYLGGTGPDGIRGFADRSVGPAGGGTRAILFSTELGYPIGSDQIIGVGFFDAGNSYNKLRDFNFIDFKKGVGAGLRIRSPFGLIGFDYAYNLNDGGWEPHLQFGTTF
ncbi:MAG: outer membrane protein assembly factor BamA [Candidatus Cloacimonetes bacterium HGW-Cloacimonetes-3]|nr:MAG: outer membrane protein assembly factor BamA [Candidatus Cloacimonetes bacterium HGW-Cloacimonetes-3]